MRDLYIVLEVTREATSEEIKISYRKLSKTKHPDTATGSTEDFAELSFAYEILSDAERRSKYDSTGSTSKEPDFQAQFLSFISERVIARIEDSDDLDFDLMEQVTSELKTVIKDLKSKEKEINKTIERLTQSKERFTAKEGDNLILLVVDSKIKGYESQIEQVKSKHIIINKTLDEISNYEYSFTIGKEIPKTYMFGDMLRQRLEELDRQEKQKEQERWR